MDSPTEALNLENATFCFCFRPLICNDVNSPSHLNILEKLFLTLMSEHFLKQNTVLLDEV